MKTVLACGLAVVVVVALVALGIFLQALLIELVWNNLIASEMNWQPMTRNAALGISVLLWLIFGGSGSGSSRKS